MCSSNVMATHPSFVGIFNGHKLSLTGDIKLNHSIHMSGYFTLVHIGGLTFLASGSLKQVYFLSRFVFFFTVHFCFIFCGGSPSL